MKDDATEIGVSSVFRARFRSRLMRPVLGCAAALLAVGALAACGGDGTYGAEVSGSSRTVGDVVYIRGSTLEWRNRLVAALQQPDTTVRLGPNVDMDMSGLETIYIARGVTLTSVSVLPPEVSTRALGPRPGQIGSAEEARRGRILGPVLFTKTRPRPLFSIRCFPDGAKNDNVRLSGFRLHGPHFGSEEGDDNLEIGIQIIACVGIEISNMELAGWSGQAIYIVDFDNGRIFNPDQVKIHDNFIHHNQHVGGNGYGVVVQDGAYARIERNVFDFNRHAIAASGGSGGYWAERNLVLKGGGRHDKWYKEYTHQFDVHGDKNCGPGSHIWNCGNAGEQIWYTENAFQYRNEHAIKLRGTPRIEASIYRNVFAHDSFDDAVKLNEGRTRIKIGSGQFANITGVDPFGKYGVCDFDGDGLDDLFLATGVTWWYSSGGELHWTYLNAATERLHQVKLGYFDSDLRCDVLAQNTGSGAWEISSGGTAPWRVLGNFGVPLDQVALGNFDPNRRDHRAGRTRITTHAFRRAPDGQWYVTALAAPNWQPAQSSSYPMNKLRFGDFTGDGVTDVLAVQGGRWSISESATGGWQRLNPTLSDDVEYLLIADVDNDNTDDILRISGGWPGKEGGWEVSWGGRTAWQTLKNLSGLELTNKTLYIYAGRFDESPGADPLVVDGTRRGHFYTKAIGIWLSAYAY